MKAFLVIVWAPSLALLSQAAYAESITVPGNYPTVQQAIEAAAPGDTISVGAGVWVENLVIDKCITLRSEQGEAVTTIDGGSQGSVVSIIGAGATGTVIEGFTITGGTGTLLDSAGPIVGGGILVDGASVSIRDNTITANAADDIGVVGAHGGGVYVGNGAVIFTGNTVSNNSIYGQGPCYGAGLCVTESSATISESSFIDNAARGTRIGMAGKGGGCGGGIGFKSSTGSIELCGVSGNSAFGSTYSKGGGIGSTSSTLEIADNSLHNNYVYGTGGGIAMDASAGSYGTIVNNTVSGNEARSAGGIHAGPALITQNTVTGNSTYWGHVGGISGGSYSQAEIVNNNICDNRAHGGAGGVGNCKYVVDNVICNNVAAGASGGMSVPGQSGFYSGNEVYGNQANIGAGIHIVDNAYTTCVVVGNHIYGNTATLNGAGIRMSWGSATIVGNNVHDNYAGEEGGGLYLTQSGGRITNNFVHRNRAGVNGGGMYSQYSSPKVINSTFRDNWVDSGQGGGLYVYWYYSLNTSVVVANSIFWNNSAGSCPEVYVSDGTAFEISYSDVSGGQGSTCGSSIVWGPGMIDEDPLFLDSDDCHLSDTSPCIEGGSNELVTNDAGDLDGDGDRDESTPFDIDGDARIEGIVDMGGDEYAGPPPNEPPIANAGPDQTQHPGTLVTLDGTGSSDPDGNYPLTYSWTFVSLPAGSVAALSDPQAMDPTFFVDKLDDFVVELTVTDALGAPSSAATVTISTYNTAPVADAGPDQAVIEIGTSVELDGSQSYDIDGDELDFTWAIVSAPPLSTATLSDPYSDRPSFVADVHGSFVFGLTVQDVWEATSDSDEIVVSFTNLQPVADAGDNQSVLVGETAYLDGSESTDANQDPLIFTWSIVARPLDSTAELSDANAVAPFLVTDKPGEYVLSLVVNDGFLNSEASNLTILARVDASVVSAKLAEAMDALNGLDSSNYKNKNLKKALTNKLNVVFKLVDEESYSEAIDKLENDILTKMDGWAISGEPDKNDWLTTSDAQALVFPILITARDYLVILYGD